MVEIIKAIFLGIIEGITEWLPISSTGHLILVEKVLGFAKDDPAFREMFEVVIQLGAVLAVVVLYFDKLWPFNSKREMGFVNKNSLSIWGKVLVGAVPAGVIGLLFDNKINELFYSEKVNAFVIAATLIIYGIAFIVIEALKKSATPKIKTMKDLSYKTAFLIGVCQILAMVPGTSRSGVTILGAVLLGTSRTVAAEYSFFMAVPVMVGASGLKILKYILEISGSGMGYSNYAMQLVVLITGMVTAFIVSVLAIKFFIGYIKKKDFSAFGYYRIALGILVIIFFALIFK